MTEHSCQGIHTSRHLAERVTHVSGTTCHLSLRSEIPHLEIFLAAFMRAGNLRETLRLPAMIAKAARRLEYLASRC